MAAQPSPRSWLGVAPRIDAEVRADGVEDGVGLAHQLGERATVVDHMVGKLHLVSERGLRVDAGACVVRRPAVPGLGAYDLQRLWRSDDDERAKRVRETVLDDKGGFVAREGCAACRELAPALHREGADAWVGDRVEPLAACVVGESTRGERFAVERAVGQQDLRTELLDELAEGVAARLHHLPRHCVGVDYGEAAGAETRGNGALARSDTPAQPKEVHAHILEARGRATPARVTVPATGRPKSTRRRFLKGAVVGGVLLATGSLVALVRTRGYDVAPERAAKLQALSVWQLIFVEQAARRICAADRPEDEGIPSADDVDVAGFVDGYIARMPAPLRKDLLRFLAYVEHMAPLGVGCSSRFTRLGSADQDRVLASVESSSSDLLRGGFDGLKACVFMGYYRDARTWTILGYDGPFVGRPDGGWTR
jgi:hypothetical protein